MKIAVCLYGLIGSQQDQNGKGILLSPLHAFNLNNSNLFSLNNPDIFIHTWNYENHHTLSDLYKPKKITSDKQIEFKSDVLNGIEITRKEKLIQIFSPSHKKYYLKKQLDANKRALSRWYSTMKSVQLMSQYEDENNISYDCVLLMRLDMAFYTPLILKAYDMNKFWASHWNIAPSKAVDFKGDFSNQNIGKGLLDFWFFSNSKNIKEFSSLYNHFNSYHPNPHIASYQRVMSLGFEICYTKYRWFDHELIRRREFGSQL